MMATRRSRRLSPRISEFWVRAITSVNSALRQQAAVDSGAATRGPYDEAQTLEQLRMLVNPKYGMPAMGVAPPPEDPMDTPRGRAIAAARKLERARTAGRAIIYTYDPAEELPAGEEDGGDEEAGAAERAGSVSMPVHLPDAVDAGALAAVPRRHRCAREHADAIAGASRVILRTSTNGEANADADIGNRDGEGDAAEAVWSPAGCTACKDTRYIDGHACRACMPPARLFHRSPDSIKERNFRFEYVYELLCNVCYKGDSECTCVVAERRQRAQIMTASMTGSVAGGSLAGDIVRALRRSVSSSSSEESCKIPSMSGAAAAVEHKRASATGAVGPGSSGGDAAGGDGGSFGDAVVLVERTVCGSSSGGVRHSDGGGAGRRAAALLEPRCSDERIFGPEGADALRRQEAADAAAELTAEASGRLDAPTGGAADTMNSGAGRLNSGGDAADAECRVRSAVRALGDGEVSSDAAAGNDANVLSVSEVEVGDAPVEKVIPCGRALMELALGASTPLGSSRSVLEDDFDLQVEPKKPSLFKKAIRWLLCSRSTARD